MQYQLRFHDRAQHYVEVEAYLPESLDRPFEMMMAVWTPGSYLVREYAKHVEQVKAFDETGQQIRVQKVRKNRWRVLRSEKYRGKTRVTYRVYAHRLRVQENYVDTELGVLNGAGLFLVPLNGEGIIPGPFEIVLNLPEEWPDAHSAMSKVEDGDRRVVFRAADYNELVDSPIVVGRLVHRQFSSLNATYHLVFGGELSSWDLDRATSDVQRIVETTEKFWQVIPFEEYWFLNLAVNARGGLEHKFSTLMMTGYDVMRSDESYKDWLSLVCHEFFHTWNGKRLRPKPLGPFNYEQEVYTPDLWVVEGFTTYYAELLLHRAGLLTAEQLLEHISRWIERMKQTPGQYVQSLSEASFDAWIKFYRPDENAANSSISYYTKGALVAFLLDTLIREKTAGKRSLDDLMREAYQLYSGEQGFEPVQFRELASRIAGEDLTGWFRQAVDEPGELDYDQAMAWLGLRWKVANEPQATGKLTAWAGWRLSCRDGRVVVESVLRDSPAARAGISAGDELLAINDRRVEASSCEKILEPWKPGESVEVTLSRREFLKRVPVTLEEAPQQQWRLEPVAESPPEVKERYRQWLEGRP